MTDTSRCIGTINELFLDTFVTLREIELVTDAEIKIYLRFSCVRRCFLYVFCQ
jgi:hypothetical protein